MLNSVDTCDMIPTLKVGVLRNNLCHSNADNLYL